MNECARNARFKLSTAFKLPEVADEINFIAVSTAQPRQVGPVSLTGSILLPSIDKLPYPSHHDLNSLEHPGLEAFTR